MQDSYLPLRKKFVEHGIGSLHKQVLRLYHLVFFNMFLIFRFSWMGLMGLANDFGSRVVW